MRNYRGFINFLIFLLILSVSLEIFGIYRFRQQRILSVYTEAIPEKKDIYALINEYRIESGKGPMVRNEALDRSALDKCQDMLERNYWSHYGPNGETPWEFMKKAGYNYSFAGENLARYFLDDLLVVEAWKKSPGHNKNLLDRTKDFGIGRCGDIVVLHIGLK